MKTPSAYWLGQYIWLFFICLIVNFFLRRPAAETGIWARLNWQLVVAAAVGALAGLGVLALIRFFFLKK